jgi:hypothetical protein
MGDWQPIESAPQNLWEPEIVLLRDECGNEAEGSWGWDDESYDPREGEVYLHGAWHKGATLNWLGFQPTHWKPLSEGASDDQ